MRVDEDVLAMLMRLKQLSPAEAARLLGVSAKALRLYERHGLVKPLRSENGWRTYGLQRWRACIRCWR